MKEVVVEERNQKLNRLNNLEQVYSDAEGKVRNKQGELKSLAAALGTSDTESLTVAQQTALQQFGKMQENLSSVQFDLMQAEGELNLAQTFSVVSRNRMSKRRSKPVRRKKNWRWRNAHRTSCDWKTKWQRFSRNIIP